MAGGSRSKVKGSAYERDLCLFMGKLFGGAFIRSANSGAFIGGKNAGRKAGLSKAQIGGQKGDIIPPEHMPKLMIEAKSYADFRFHQLLQPGPMPQLEEWISQTKEASDEGDLVFICFKINRRGSFVFVEESLDSYVLGNHTVYTEGSVRGVVTELESFFTNNRASILARSA